MFIIRVLKEHTAYIQTMILKKSLTLILHSTILLSRTTPSLKKAADPQSVANEGHLRVQILCLLFTVSIGAYQSH